MVHFKTILWFVLCISIVLLWIGIRTPFLHGQEKFANWDGGVTGVSLQQLSTDALDRAPSTSEVKDDYTLLLVYADYAMRKGGDDAVKALRVFADMRDRLFDVHDFRDNLVLDDFRGNWPEWLTQPDPAVDVAYTCMDAATAEAHVLAFLQKNYPQEDKVDEQTGSTIRNIIEDFGYRFVFKKRSETVELAEEFLKKPLLRGWSSPCQVK